MFLSIKMIIFMNIESNVRIELCGSLADWLGWKRWKDCNCGIDMEEKRKNFNKSERIRNWVKGYFGQFWGENIMDYYSVNYFVVYGADSMAYLKVRQEIDWKNKIHRLIWFEQRLIGNWENILGIADLMGWEFKKRMKMEDGNGRYDNKRIIVSIVMDNKRGQFGQFINFEEDCRWDVHNESWVILRYGWNKDTGNKSFLHNSMRGKGYFGQFCFINAMN